MKISSREMNPRNKFSNYYSTISDAALLNILDHSHQYQEAAIEAAAQELANRQLAESDMLAARQQLVLEKAENEKYKKKIKVIESNIRSKGTSFIDSINPLLSDLSSTEKKIRILICTFGGLFLHDYK